MEFAASMDRTTRISTFIVTLIFAAVPVLGIVLGTTSGNWVAAAVGCLLAVIYGVVYAYRPTGYGVTSAGLVIHRQAGDLHIAASNIRKVETLERKQLRFAIRTFGVGGLFGYFGSFYTSSLGSMTWYITRRDSTVLIETNRSKILVSPDDRSAFLDALQAVS